MTKLLNKIERRLGLQVITLPEKINKDSWHIIIEEDTIPEFSRYFPNKIVSIIDNKCHKNPSCGLSAQNAAGWHRTFQRWYFPENR